MHQYVGPVLYTKLSPKQEDHVLEDIERMLQDRSKRGEDDDVAARTARPGRLRYPLMLFSALTLVAALVPAGLLRSDLLTRVAHQVTGD